MPTRSVPRIARLRIGDRMTAPPAELCQHCHRAIEPVDGPGVKYSHRHVDDKRICCRSVYEPEIATPVSQPTTKEN